MRLKILFLSLCLLLIPRTSTPKVKDRPQAIKLLVAELKTKCPSCAYVVIPGQTVENDVVVDCDYFLVIDGGEKIRAYRVQTPEGSVIIVHFPNKTFNVPLRQFLKKAAE